MRAQDYVFALPGSATLAGFVWFLTSLVQHVFVWLPLVLLLIVLLVASLARRTS